MKTRAKEFAVAMARVMPVLKTRTTIPVLSCVRVQAGAGLMGVTSTDLDAFAFASCPCEGDLEPVCVDATMLNYLVRQAGEEIELKANHGRLVVSGNGTARLGVQDVTQFPEWPSPPGKALGISTTDLAECVAGVAWAPDTNSKIAFDLWRESIWVKSTAKHIEVCGTDSKLFAYVNRPLIGAAAEFLFPSSQAKLLTDALMTTDSTVHLSDRYLSTHNPTFRVAIKLVEGRFIPIEILLAKPTKPLGTINTSAVLECLHTIKTLGSAEPYIEAKLIFEAESLRVIYSGARGDFDRSIPFHNEGEESTIRVDVGRAIKVFAHVPPDAKAAIDATSIIFRNAEWAIALALLQ